jgi:uncharacterized membrane protein
MADENAGRELGKDPAAGFLAGLRQRSLKHHGHWMSLGWLLILSGPIAGFFLFLGLIEFFDYVGLSPNLPILPPVLIALIGGTVFEVVQAGRRRVQAPLHVILERDPRSPVLYLRPFRSDQAKSSWWKAFLYRSSSLISVFMDEPDPKPLVSYVARAARAVGPFIEIGNSKEGVPQLGVTPIYCGDDEWQEIVRNLMIYSQAIVVTPPGKSENTLWEMETALAVVPIEKLFLLYGTPGSNSVEDVENVIGVRDFAREKLRVGIPIDFTGPGVLGFFLPDRRPLLCRTKEGPFGDEVANSLYLAFAKAGMVSKRPSLLDAATLRFILGVILAVILALAGFLRFARVCPPFCG